MRLADLYGPSSATPTGVTPWPRPGRRGSVDRGRAAGAGRRRPGRGAGRGLAPSAGRDQGRLLRLLRGPAGAARRDARPLGAPRPRRDRARRARGRGCPDRPRLFAIALTSPTSSCAVDLTVRDWARRDASVADASAASTTAGWTTCAHCCALLRRPRRRRGPLHDRVLPRVGGHLIAADHRGRSRQDMRTLISERLFRALVARRRSGFATRAPFTEPQYRPTRTASRLQPHRPAASSDQGNLVATVRLTWARRSRAVPTRWFAGRARSYPGLRTTVKPIGLLV